MPHLVLSYIIFRLVIYVLCFLPYCCRKEKVNGFTDQTSIIAVIHTAKISLISSAAVILSNIVPIFRSIGLLIKKTVIVFCPR